jgi:hypothetical protein
MMVIPVPGVGVPAKQARSGLKGSQSEEGAGVRRDISRFIAINTPRSFHADYRDRAPVPPLLTGGRHICR